MDAESLTNLLRRETAAAGSIRAWAERHEVSGPYVSDVLLGKRTPGPAILRALGLRKVTETTYVSVERKGGT